MATAIENSRTNRQVARPVAPGSESAAVAFLVFEDNDGGSRWTIRGSDGETLAQLGRPSARAAREDSDAERWLDDGGSFGGETVTQWPARS